MHGRRACHRFYYPSRREKPPGRLERRGKIHELSDVQAIGAAAENMALIAAEWESAAYGTAIFSLPMMN